MTQSASSLPNLVKATTGGFNALLYNSAFTQAATPGLVDIVSGSNNLTSNACSVCTSTTGYDDITGLGVPNVGQFLSQFVTAY